MRATQVLHLHSLFLAAHIQVGAAAAQSPPVLTHRSTLPAALLVPLPQAAVRAVV